MRLVCIIALLLCLAPTCLAAANAWTTDQGVVLEAKVNGQPVRLLFDTGAETICLFGATARRLGLKVTSPPVDAKAQPGEILAGKSEECEFSLGKVTGRTPLPVYDPPGELPLQGVDGLLAWYPFRQDNIFLVSNRRERVTTLPALPEDIATWTKWTINVKQRALTIEVPGPDGQRALVQIDTGAFGGVSLNARRWQQWRDAHKDAPASPVAFFLPGSGLLVREECWADTLDIAGFHVTDVPVMQGRPEKENQIGSEATIGLFGLLRFETMIDGARGTLYMRPVQTPPPPYRHNRLGAVFAPKDMASQDLIACVVEGTPAFQAGIRNEDILLAIGNLDVTKWRTDPAVLPLTRFWEQPAGAELRLTVSRDGRRFDCTPRLQDILGTDPR